MWPKKIGPKGLRAKASNVVVEYVYMNSFNVLDLLIQYPAAAGWKVSETICELMIFRLWSCRRGCSPMC